MLIAKFIKKLKEIPESPQARTCLALLIPLQEKELTIQNNGKEKKEAKEEKIDIVEKAEKKADAIKQIIKDLCNLIEKLQKLTLESTVHETRILLHKIEKAAVRSLADLNTKEANEALYYAHKIFDYRNTTLPYYRYRWVNNFPSKIREELRKKYLCDPGHNQCKAKLYAKISGELCRQKRDRSPFQAFLNDIDNSAFSKELLGIYINAAQHQYSSSPATGGMYGRYYRAKNANPIGPQDEESWQKETADDEFSPVLDLRRKF